jgi:serine phosphatase RsbU (regulator of sigma subunit)
MIVHSTLKSGFTPGEVALLQAFANQAALAMQRAGLDEQLRAKISQLEAAQVELAKKERLERELELARQVQQSLLPKTFPEIPGFRFAAHNEPARQVGGDFYDLFPLSSGRFGVAIGDVSDKGLPAALYMALTRSLLLAEARREQSPRAVLTSVNQLLLALSQPSMFVTIFYGVIDPASRRLTYARAGHDRPAILRDERVQLLVGQGAALGILEEQDLHLSEEQLELFPGDRLVLYTDGLTDALSPHGEILDWEGLKEKFEAHSGLSPEPFCDAIFADLQAYQGSQAPYDDMTLLVVGVESN